MRKFLAIALLLTLIGSAMAPDRVVAQEATPEPATGEAVAIYSADGNAIGTVTINNIIDPFEDYDGSYSPQRGYHYVVLDVTVTNTSQRAITFDPYSLIVVDAEGFVANSAFVGFSDNVTTPPLEYTDALAPGSEASGLVAYEVFSGSSVSRILYSSGFDSMTTILDLRPAQVAAGTPVSIIGSTGSEIAQVTVNGVADPFEAYDEFSTPPRGSRYVAVDVTVANTGQRTLSTAPSNFSAVDDIGLLVDQPFVSSSDPGFVNFDYLDLEPGESQQGIVYFQVLQGVPLVQIIYGDTYSTNIVVADLALGAPAISAQPAAPAAPSSPDCEGLVEWGTDFMSRLIQAGVLTSSFQDVEPEDLDPAALREVADQLSVLAQETRDSNPPPAAVELNTYFADVFYEQLSAITIQIADSIESNDLAAAAEAEAAAEALLDLFEPDGEAVRLLEALETECPNEIETLDNM